MTDPAMYMDGAAALVKSLFVQGPQIMDRSKPVVSALLQDGLADIRSAYLFLTAKGVSVAVQAGFHKDKEAFNDQTNKKGFMPIGKLVREPFVPLLLARIHDASPELKRVHGVGANIRWLNWGWYAPERRTWINAQGEVMTVEHTTHFAAMPEYKP